MSDAVFRCHACGGPIEVLAGETVSRRAECPKCGADVKVCLNCMFFDTSRSNQCAESQADYVSDKSSANFCDWFKPRTTVDLVGRKDPAPDAKNAFDDLFK